MRKGLLYLTILLTLALSGCGTQEADPREAYRSMSGCAMEAEVTCDQEGVPWTGTLRCVYLPEGECTVEVLAPDSIAGVRAVLDGDRRSLRFNGKNLDAGAVSQEGLSPAECLPAMVDALRQGWLLEENRENWDGVPCVRLALDRDGTVADKVQTTLWLRQSDGTPLRGEIAVDGETVLWAEFTSFAFYGIMDP